MLPPALVLTIKICGVTQSFRLLAAVVLLGCGGCTPPGPRALLQGKKLIDAGDPVRAIEPLERAAQLLPKNALAWNYLGLAYHGSGQFDGAVKAYRAALALDHKLSPVRYNLGCLYLEENNLTAATEELKSFTLLQPGAAEGWVKLGTAQLRARRLDEAERSFRTVVELQSDNAEALNGLGLIQVQRRRWQEALNHFNAAASHAPSYAPALLNAAVVQHQYLNTRTLALQRYRDYLALQPRAADWVSVQATARQLELELSPPSTTARTNRVPTSLVSTAKPQPGVVQPGPPPRSPSNAVSSAVAAIRTNPPPERLAVKNAAPPLPTTTSSTGSQVKLPAAESARASRAATNKTLEASMPKPIEIEVTRVNSELVVKPAQDLTRAPGTASSQDGSVAGSRSEPPLATNQSKRSFLSRLNPFGGRSRSGTEDGTNQASSVRSTGEPSLVSAPRYTHLNPLAPTAGNRVEAEKAFKQGLKAYNDGSRAGAIKEYRAAVKTDPAYYDAYYNLGLAALEKGDAPLSLWAHEIALALRPQADDARHNFALALKAGGYWHDAGEQLQRVLNQNASDVRAHLSLANLCSQQLRQPERARDHYQRVLEIDPRHPEAAKIRFWLAANP